MSNRATEVNERQKKRNFFTMKFKKFEMILGDEPKPFTLIAFLILVAIAVTMFS